MSDGPLGIVSHYLGRLAVAGLAMKDEELLARYAKTRDEEAFALLVHRYGPMVLGVCRRALGYSGRAEDAFQATFLALSRNASKIGTCVPGWLYRVAVRTSRKALQHVPCPPTTDRADSRDPFAESEWKDVRRLLDEELDRLPAKWRMPLVLCYLEGLTRDEAAAQLQISLRTLHRRLDEGRSKLRGRLKKRGLAPALLAAAVLGMDDLRASVPESLLGRAVSVVQESSAPSAVWSLIRPSNPLGGLSMKISLCGVLIAGAALVILGERQQSDASPPKQEPAPPVLARAPNEKQKPADEAMTKEVKKAQAKGIEYLKQKQKKQDGDGIWNWEHNDQLTSLQPGGCSCLAMLALLESGFTMDDEVIARGMKYLRSLEPKLTYVVSLQTQVFVKANQKEDAERIKKNVEWLEDAAVWKDGKLLGWSYGSNAGRRGDNSNTRYAVSALFAAHKAGFKTKNKFWEEVRDFYIRNQTRGGGWTYMNENAAVKGTHTMTVSGLLGLAQANEIIGKEDVAAKAASTAGSEWLAKEFRLVNAPHTLYNFDVVAALGRARDQRFIGEGDKKRDWYKEGCEWLLKNQKAGGEWQIATALDNFPVVSTSFALRFLASRQN